MIDKLKRKLSKARWNQKNRERINQARRAWYHANPDKALAQQRRYREKHPKDSQWWKTHREKELARKKAYYKANPDKARAVGRRQYRKNPDRYKRNAKKWITNNIADLGDYYVRSLIAKDTHLPPSAWPDSLVSLKRAQLQLTRLCRKSRTTTN